MLTLHYLNDSRAQRILWMLEELEVPYEIKVWKRDPSTNLAPAAFKEVHPLGKFPVVEDGPHTLAESGAVVAYLADTYGPQFLPDDPVEREQVRYWMHYAEGSLMPPLLMSYIFGLIRKKAPFFVRPIAMFGPGLIQKAYLSAAVKNHLSYVNNHLDGREFLVGTSLTAADVQMSFPLEASISRADDSYPHIEAYVRRIQARPAYKRALGKVDVPYAYVLKD